jgi:DNA-binding XRE family transcriptional regulator
VADGGRIRQGLGKIGRIVSGFEDMGRMCSLAMSTPVSAAAQELGSRVRARRRELGMSQERLAEACGVHWTFLGQVERGRRNISLHNILKIAAGLEVDAGVLVQGLRAPGPPASSNAHKRQSSSQRSVGD